MWAKGSRGLLLPGSFHSGQWLHCTLTSFIVFVAEIRQYMHYYCSHATSALFFDPYFLDCLFFSTAWQFPCHVTELFGKAQTRANRCTNCPLSYKEKHGVGKVLAFSLMVKLKGQHPEYQSWPFEWPPVQFAFLWSAAKPKVNQQGFVKSNRRRRERELDESMSWKLLN